MISRILKLTLTTLLFMFLSMDSYCQEYICDWSRLSLRPDFAKSRSIRKYDFSNSEFPITTSKSSFVYEDKKYVLRDKNGQQIGNDEYQYLATKIPTHIIAQTLEGKYCIFNDRHELIEKPIYDDMHIMSSKKGWLLKKDNLWGAVDLDMNQIIDFQFDIFAFVDDEHFIGISQGDLSLCSITDGIVKNFGKVCFKIVGNKFRKFICIKENINSTDNDVLYDLKGNDIYNQHRIQSVDIFADSLAIKLKTGSQDLRL